MMHSPGAAGLDLAPLYDRCLFRSDASVDSHTQVAREFSDHGLTWKGGPVDTAMFKARARRLELYMLRYGAAVDIHTRPFHDFALVHLAVKGSADITADGRRLTVRQGGVAVLAPQRDLRMSWQEGSEHLILKIPHNFLREVAGQAQQASFASALPCVGLLHGAAAGPWRGQMQSLLQATALGADAPADPAQTAWVDHFESGIVRFLFAYGGANDIRIDRDPAGSAAAPASGARQDARRLEAVERFITQRLSAPVSMEDLARAAGIGVRALHALFQRSYRMTPMELLRDRRLDAVRDHLRTTPAANIAETALGFGFGHIGRFSGYYRERFGELPSETRSRG